MSDTKAFRAQLDQAIAEASHTAGGIPLIDAGALDLRDAQAGPLIIALADIIEATCVRSAAVPKTHATAA